MLMCCKRCSQVIEVATLAEHLLDECEHKADYEPCATCGDALLGKDLEAHMAAQACHPLPDPAAGQRCSLCHGDIEPGREGWLHHLLESGCPSNPRGKGGAAAAAAAKGAAATSPG